jgi:hypothetical protein
VKAKARLVSNEFDVMVIGETRSLGARTGGPQ